MPDSAFPRATASLMPRFMPCPPSGLCSCAASPASTARQAVDLLLRQLEPCPGIVIDRYWNTLRMNSGMRHFLGRFPICDSVKPHNGVRFVFHPKGLRPFIENWESVAARIIQRVHREVVANPSDETMKAFLEELLSYPAVPSRWRILDVDDSPPPFLTINYKWNNSTLRWFSTLATFGSPQEADALSRDSRLIAMDPDWFSLPPRCRRSTVKQSTESMQDLSEGIEICPCQP